MFKLMRRAWRYLTAALTGKFNEAADPKIPLEQAIAEAQDQHRRLGGQGANGSARQAVLMADEATKKGDTAQATQYAQAAEAFANRLIAVEREVESLKQLHYQSTQAADQAKAAVTQNSTALQKKLAERQ